MNPTAALKHFNLSRKDSEWYEIFEIMLFRVVVVVVLTVSYIDKVAVRLFHAAVES